MRPPDVLNITKIPLWLRSKGYFCVTLKSEFKIGRYPESEMDTYDYYSDDDGRQHKYLLDSRQSPFPKRVFFYYLHKSNCYLHKLSVQLDYSYSFLLHISLTLIPFALESLANSL